MAKKNAIVSSELATYEPQISDEDLVEQDLGFPPFWCPSEEKTKDGDYGKFFARLVGSDDSDPNFRRWVFEALHETLGHKGGGDDGEDVIVKSGEFFTMTKYGGLERLREFGGLRVRITALKKVPHFVKAKGTMGSRWVFEVKLHKEDVATLDQRREAAVSGPPAPKALGARSVEGSAAS